MLFKTSPFPFSNVSLLYLLQPPGACEGGAHWCGWGRSASLPPGRGHTQPAIAERRARSGGGSCHRGPGVEHRAESGPEGRDTQRDQSPPPPPHPPEPSRQPEEEKIATVHLWEKERKKENVFFFVLFWRKMQATKDDIEKHQTGLDDLRYFQTQKEKTVEHCFTSMCFFSDTWLRGVTPLNAYTLTQTRTQTHSFMSHHVSLSSLVTSASV